MRSTFFLPAFTALLLGASACNSDIQPADPVAVDGVRVTPQVVQFSAIGEARQLVATISPANATDQAIEWESTDPAVASVDASGLVTANAAGAGVFVTAFTHDGHFQSSANVSVVP